jgi:hypothetical protein
MWAKVIAPQFFFLKAIEQTKFGKKGWKLIKTSWDTFEGDHHFKWQLVISSRNFKVAAKTCQQPEVGLLNVKVGLKQENKVWLKS